jgi:hypothetical protein
MGIRSEEVFCEGVDQLIIHCDIQFLFPALRLGSVLQFKGITLL